MFIIKKYEVNHGGESFLIGGLFLRSMLTFLATRRDAILSGFIREITR